MRRNRRRRCNDGRIVINIDQIRFDGLRVRVRMRKRIRRRMRMRMRGVVKLWSRGWSCGSSGSSGSSPNSRSLTSERMCRW